MNAPSRRRALGALGALAALGAAAAPSRAADLTKVRAAALPIVDTSPFFAALKQGYFSAEGLDVSIAPEYTGTVGLSGAVAGSYDIVYTNVPSTLAAIEHGIKLRLVALASPIGPPDITALVIRKGENLRTAKAFAGKSVGINGLRNLQWMVMRAWLKAGGIDPDQVTLRDVPFPQMADALRTKQVDGIFAIEPFLSADVHDPEMEVAAHPFDVIPRVRSAGWAVTEAYAEKNADTIKRFVAALTKGADWINANRGKPAFVELVASYTKMDPARVTQMGMPTAMASVDPNEIRRIAQLMREVGLLQGDIDASKTIFVAK